MGKRAMPLFAAAITIAAGLLLTPTASASAEAQGCSVTASWGMVDGSRSRLLLHGKNVCPPGVTNNVISARIFANGVEVAQRSSSTGTLDWVHFCTGALTTDWKAVWNSGQVTEGTFDCN
ncbi:hypothetical protein [Nocardia arthritidis]|uniref:Secreted protein n=1 Tax=Nocardia arthritidis TaxID=228602 RepID=A0A6G9YIY3_9NOCA|nr:hypothetical protein [Nocardia arthritidis]QIS13265.1 hypothetical protein F5544_27055 [Nocardia arthritidis]